MTDGPRLLAGRYQVGNLIGRGGMADVHQGLDTRLGRRVAIKLLKPALANDPRFRKLFREEAQKAARMAHPTIVRVFDAGEETVTGDDGVESQWPYIVMEFVDGRLLKDIIAEGPMEAEEASRIIGGVLTALEYSHRALLVHRDIKPGNIMITQTGQVKVMDFGIARAVSDNSSTVAETGAVLGTAQYFSPEQARGETVDARTDLYSTGVVLFEMLTGRPPFRGDRAAAVAYQHISETPAVPSSINDQLTSAIDTVVLHSLKKDKFERFQTAAEFREDVELAASGHVPARKAPAEDFGATLFGSPASSEPGPDAAFRQLTAPDDDRSVRTQQRPPVAWIWAGVAILAAVLLGVAFWVVSLPNQPQDLGNTLSVQVPDLTTGTYDEASATLTGLELVPNRLGEVSDSVPLDQVIRTVPEAGTRVSKDQVVSVYVSLGPRSTSVPTLEGLSLEGATQALEAANLVLGSVVTEHDATTPADTVISSTPDVGAGVVEGSTVDLTVSDGLVAVPNLVGQPYQTALQTLQDLGLDVTPTPDMTCTGGAVTQQDLPAGDHAQGSAIAVRYCPLA